MSRLHVRFLLVIASCLLGLAAVSLADRPPVRFFSSEVTRMAVSDRIADVPPSGDGESLAPAGAEDVAHGDGAGVAVREAYESGVVLARVDRDADPDETYERLAGVGGIVAHVPTAQEIASGVIELEVARGVSVEEAVEQLCASGLVEAAQPNYLYRLAETGGISELRDAADPLAGLAREDGSVEEDGGTQVPQEDGTAGQGDTLEKTLAAHDAEADGRLGFEAEHGDPEDAAAGTDPMGGGPATGTGAAGLRAAVAQVNDPMASEQWALSSIHAYEAWSRARCEGAVTVAIIDDGCDVSHADLQANVVAAYNEYHARTGKGSSSVRNSRSSHGTHVAGIVSAVADNALGVAGVSYNARVMPIRVFSDAGTATTADLVNAYEYLLDHATELDVRVVNMSLGGRDDGVKDDALYDEIDKAYAKGIVTVAAAGNSYFDDGTYTDVPYDCYPGDYGPVVSVINLAQTPGGSEVRRDASSNYNGSGEADKNISAPGTRILSTYSQDNTAFMMMSGTSMASPCVAGVLALEFAANRDLTAEQAVRVLYGSATDLGAVGWDREFGYGEVNAAAAVNGAKSVSDFAPTVSYRAHVQNEGWQNWVEDGSFAGTTGRAERLEALDARLVDAPCDGSLQYRSHVQNIGWESVWRSDGTTSGTVGSSLRLEAVQMRLSGTMAERYDVYYRVHAQNYGWLGWASNGESAGTVGYGYRLECVQIVLVRRGGQAPGDTTGALRAQLVSYRSHVQNVGWQPYASDGVVSGTIGRSLRLEAVVASVADLGYSGAIAYRTHIQNLGWEQAWRGAGSISGTSGRALRLEAIQLRLTGELSERYDVYYRVHAQNYGWLGWAGNGESAGTAGLSLRLEALQVKLVPKGDPAPGSLARPFVT